MRQHLYSSLPTDAHCSLMPLDVFACEMVKNCVGMQNKKESNCWKEDRTFNHHSIIQPLIILKGRVWTMMKSFVVFSAVWFSLFYAFHAQFFPNMEFSVFWLRYVASKNFDVCSTVNYRLQCLVYSNLNSYHAALVFITLTVGLLYVVLGQSSRGHKA